MPVHRFAKPRQQYMGPTRDFREPRQQYRGATRDFREPPITPIDPQVPVFGSASRIERAPSYLMGEKGATFDPGPRYTGPTRDFPEPTWIRPLGSARRSEWFKRNFHLFNPTTTFVPFIPPAAIKGTAEGIIEPVLSQFQKQLALASSIAQTSIGDVLRLRSPTVPWDVLVAAMYRRPIKIKGLEELYQPGEFIEKFKTQDFPGLPDIEELDEFVEHNLKSGIKPIYDQLNKLQDRPEDIPRTGSFFLDDRVEKWLNERPGTGVMEHHPDRSYLNNSGLFPYSIAGGRTEEEVYKLAQKITKWVPNRFVDHISGVIKLSEAKDKYLEQGLSWTEAHRKAYEDVDLPPGAKGASEIAIEALIPYSGLIKASRWAWRSAKQGPKVGRHIFTEASDRIRNSSASSVRAAMPSSMKEALGLAHRVIITEPGLWFPTKQITPLSQPIQNVPDLWRHAFSDLILPSRTRESIEMIVKAVNDGLDNFAQQLKKSGDVPPEQRLPSYPKDIPSSKSTTVAPTTPAAQAAGKVTDVPTVREVGEELIPGTGVTSGTILPYLKKPLKAYSNVQLERMRWASVKGSVGNIRSSSPGVKFYEAELAKRKRIAADPAIPGADVPIIPPTTARGAAQPTVAAKRDILIQSFTKEMSRRGVELTDEIYGQIIAAQRSLGTSDIRSKSLLFDIIARRHGGSRKTTISEILHDVSKFEMNRLEVGIRRGGYDGDLYELIMREIDDIVHAPDIPKTRRQVKLDPRLEDLIKERGLDGNEKSVIQRAVNEIWLEGGDPYMVGRAIMELRAKAKGLPPPTSAVNDSSAGLLNMIMSPGIVGTKEGRIAVQQFDGARKYTAAQLKDWSNDSNRAIKEIYKKATGKKDAQGFKEGIKIVSGEPQISPTLGYKLLKHLHGEGEAPLQWKKYLEKLKEYIRIEESDMLAYDHSFSKKMLAGTYFPRLWKDGHGVPMTLDKAFFLYQRTDMLFEDLFKAGFVPLSWNPMHMVALRRMAGIQLRELDLVAKRMEIANEVIAVSSKDYGRTLIDINTGKKLSKKWRVPQIGAPFEPRMKIGIRQSGDLKLDDVTNGLAVRNARAHELESVYGIPYSGDSFLKKLDKFGTTTKLVKLFGTFFQHFDLGARTTFAAATKTSVMSGGGALISVPYWRYIGRMFAGQFFPRKREELLKRIISNEPFIKGRNITPATVYQHGWNAGGDISLLKRDTLDTIEEIAKTTTTPPGMGPTIARRLDRLYAWFKEGLFDNAWPLSQEYALRHFIVPKLAKIHPTWSDDLISADAALEVNFMFSSQAVWQSILKDPQFRQWSRIALFSPNETEAWLQQALRAVSGENKALWQEYWLGMGITLVVMANAIHMVSTQGKPLPAERYIPFNFDFGWGFNNLFLSPNAPFTGLGGAELHIDLLGQADTVLRLISNPQRFVRDRFSTIAGAGTTQVTSTAYGGYKIKGWKDRIAQLAVDLGLPIGAASLAEIIRQSFGLDYIFNPNEPRIGLFGNLTSGTGLPIHAESVRSRMLKLAESNNFRERRAKTGMPEWDGSYDSLEPFEVAELNNHPSIREYRDVLGELPSKKSRKMIEDLYDDQIVSDRRVGVWDRNLLRWIESMPYAGDTEFGAPRLRPDRWVRDLRLRQIATHAKREAIEVYEEREYKTPKGGVEAARNKYYELVTEYFGKDSGASQDEQWDDVRSEFMATLTPEEQRYVEMNITPNRTPLIKEYMDDMKILDEGYFYITSMVMEKQNIKKKYAYYQDLGPGKKQVFRQGRENDDLDIALKVATELKLKAREQHSIIDELLYKWGLTYKLRSPALIKQMEQLASSPAYTPSPTSPSIPQQVQDTDQRTIPVHKTLAELVGLIN